MPSAFKMINKILGPAMGAGQLAMGILEGPAGIPMDVAGGLQLAQGLTTDLAGTPQMSMPSIKAPALTSAPIGGTPNIPTPAGQGLTLSGGGAGPPPATGAGVQSPDVLSQAIQTAMGGPGGDPFGAYGGYGQQAFA